jgi:UDP-2-acetamido-2-deoxy-ribo-hexuluronate aminotransferase
MNNIDYSGLREQYKLHKNEINKNIQKVLDHGSYIMGPEINELEEFLADFVGVKHCITVSSGTEALLISLMALGVAPGDEVITSSFSFISAAEAIALLQAKPILVDINLETANIDEGKIEAVISRKTKAIIPVSLYGQPSNMQAINEIAKKHNLKVIEDAAQSFGAEYRGAKSCNLSELGVTSFFPTKILGCYGDGGAIFTNNNSLEKICREIRIHGQQKKYEHVRLGVGGRMDTIQAAILIAKIKYLNEEIKVRQNIAKEYDTRIKNEITKIKVIPDAKSVYGQYTIRIKNRIDFLEKMKLAGIPTAIHYPIPIGNQEGYKKYKPEAEIYKNAEIMSSQVVSIPISSYLKKNEIDYIINKINEFKI